MAVFEFPPDARCPAENEQRLAARMGPMARDGPSLYSGRYRPIRGGYGTFRGVCKYVCDKCRICFSNQGSPRPRTNTAALVNRSTNSGVPVGQSIGRATLNISGPNAGARRGCVGYAYCRVAHCGALGVGCKYDEGERGGF